MSAFYFNLLMYFSMEMHAVLLELTSNMCDSYNEILGEYADFDEAVRNMPEDRHVTEEYSDGFTAWWNYHYCIIAH